MEGNTSCPRVPETVTVFCQNHAEIVINGLWTCLQAKRRTDVNFQYGRRCTRAHRLILELFLTAENIDRTWSQPPNDHLQHSSDLLGFLLEFIYKGRVTLTPGEREELLAAARDLEFQILVDSIEVSVQSERVPALTAIRVAAVRSSLPNCNIRLPCAKPLVDTIESSVRSEVIPTLSSDEVASVRSCQVNLGLRVSGPNWSNRPCPSSRKQKHRTGSNAVAISKFQTPLGSESEASYEWDPLAEIFKLNSPDRSDPSLADEEEDCEPAWEVADESSDGSFNTETAKQSTNKRRRTKKKPSKSKRLPPVEKVADEGGPPTGHCCSHCEFESTDYRLYVRHLSSSHKRNANDEPLPRFKCPDCPYESTRASETRLHKRTVHDKILPFSCTEAGCRFAANRPSGLKRHLEVVHEKGESRYPCPQCGKRCHSQAALQLHNLVHTQVKEYVCAHCSRAFSRPKALKSHEEVVHALAPARFVCENCGKRCATSCRLREHLLTHTDVAKPHACEMCSYRARDRIDVRKHQEVVHGVGPARFACETCGKRCSGLSSLANHQMTHSKEKPFKCPHCSYASCLSSSLKSHLDVVHGQGVGRFTCDTCGKRCPSRGELIMHKQTHTKEKSFKCDLCDHASAHTSNLRKHLRTVHNQTAADYRRTTRKFGSTEKELPGAVFETSISSDVPADASCFVQTVSEGPCIEDADSSSSSTVEAVADGPCKEEDDTKGSSLEEAVADSPCTEEAMVDGPA